MKPAPLPSLPPPAIPAGLEGLLPDFIREMEKDAALLVQLVEGDRTHLADHVHAMRGKCGMFGEAFLYACLTCLEEGLAQDDLALIREKTAEILGRALQLTGLDRDSRHGVGI